MSETISNGELVEFPDSRYNWSQHYVVVSQSETHITVRTEPKTVVGGGEHEYTMEWAQAIDLGIRRVRA